MAQVVNRAWEKPGLRHTQKEAHSVELSWGSHPHHCASEYSTGHRDSREPTARTHPSKDQVTRYFETRIAEEEDASPESKGRGIEIQFLIHLQRGDTDVSAVKITEDVEQKDKKNNERNNGDDKYAPTN